MAYRYAVFASLAAVFLTSCNSMSKEECAVADWAVVGETDGASGREPQERFAAHVKSCARINIVPDQSAWYKGYQIGVQRYCVPLNGLSRGEAGDPYYNVCPPDQSASFLQAYGIGRKAFEERSRLNSLRNNISSKEASINRLYEDLKNTTDIQQQRNIRDEIDKLDREIRRVRLDVSDAEFRLNAIQREVDSFRQQIF